MEQESLPTFTSLLPEKRESRVVESDKLIPLVPPSKHKETASVGLQSPEHSQRRDIPSLMPVQRPSRFVESGGKLAAIAGHETHAGKKVPGKELEKPSHAVLGDRVSALVPPNSESHKREIPSLMPVMREVRGSSGITGGIGRIEPRSVMERATPLAAPSARFEDFMGMGGMNGGEGLAFSGSKGLTEPRTFDSFVHSM